MNSIDKLNVVWNTRLSRGFVDETFSTDDGNRSHVSVNQATLHLSFEWGSMAIYPEHGRKSHSRVRYCPHASVGTTRKDVIVI